MSKIISAPSSFCKHENAEKIIEGIKMLPILKNFDQLKEEDKRKIFHKKELSLTFSDPKPILKDRLNSVLIIYFFYGICAILPWYLLQMANDFLINVKLNTPISSGTFYQIKFKFISGLIWNAAFLLMTIFNLINCDRRFNQIDRIPFCLIGSAFSIGSIIVLSILDSKNWSNSFFICFSLIICLLAALNGIIFSSSIYAAAMLPPKYTNSILLGYMSSGLFYSLISILFKYCKFSKISSVNATWCNIDNCTNCQSQFIFQHIRNYYRYHLDIAKDNMTANEKARRTLFHMPYIRTIKRFWPLYVCIWLLMFTTLSSFTSYQKQIKPIKTQLDSFIVSNDLFVDITCDLTYYIATCLGSLTCFAFKKPSIKLSLAFSFLKSILTSCFFILCNFEPDKRKNLPVLVENDYVYWSGAFICHYSTALMVCLLMSFAPKEIKFKYKQSAALLTAFSFIFGSLCGSEFSRFFETIVVII
ncbi:equilibrative nucleoside transporter 1 [Brachionus plicatilis]|uniref:Equilibrative nucleoside transporter 1 n=1 Tax=Brachionus plicatilis TaxID=10195 RepID=A0A3M7T8S5_BRAPC|nr:equilibrative nucleoside transporter 1 [Brachionus plicatilis]